MKRSNQMTREKFYAHCKRYEERWQRQKAEIQSLQFMQQTNEYTAFYLIDELERDLFQCCHSSLKQFRILSGGRVPSQPIPEEVKKDEIHCSKEVILFIEYLMAYVDWLSIGTCDAAAKEHQWSLCQELSWLAKLWQHNFNDAPILQYNALRRYGFDGLSNAFLVGTKSAEMRLYPRYKNALTRIARKEQEKADLHQVKFDFLLSKSADLPHIEVEGARILDTSMHGLHKWYKFVNHACEELDELANDASYYTNDGTEAVSLLDSIPDDGPTPEQIVMDAELLLQVQCAVAELPPKQKQIIELRAQGMDYAAIAHKCGIAEGTVKATISQVRAKFQKRLAA